MCHQAGRGDGCFNWVDLYGVKDGNHPNRKVSVVDISSLRYSVVQTIEKPSLVLSQDYCNSLSEAGSFRFSKTTSTSSMCSWTVTSGLRYGSSISATVGIPSLAQTTFSESIEMSFS